MFPHPLSWECKGVLVDARASQLFLLRRVHEVCVCVEELAPRRASTALSLSAAYFLCSTNLCWKREDFPQRKHFCEQHTHTHTHRCFLLCLLSNCGKQKPTVGFSESGKTTIGEQKNKKKAVNFIWSSCTRCYLFAKLYIWVLYKRGTSVLVGSA